MYAMNNFLSIKEDTEPSDYTPLKIVKLKCTKSLYSWLHFLGSFPYF